MRSLFRLSPSPLKTDVDPSWFSKIFAFFDTDFNNLSSVVMSGFPTPVHSFLNDIDRIATVNYTPSDDDVIRARLRTLGVQEHQFVFEEGACVSVATGRTGD